MNPIKRAHWGEPVGRCVHSAALINVHPRRGRDIVAAAELTTVEDCDIANIITRRIGIGLQLATDTAFRAQSARCAL